MCSIKKIPNVGISQIGVAIPKYFVSLDELSKKRGLSSDYTSKGLGVFQSRIPYKVSIEDLAVEALRKIKYQDVERFYIGTESDPDLSKPLSTEIINKRLGLDKTPFQYKFACLGGMEALVSACEYSVANDGRPAIALALDRSIYSKADRRAEVTQGSAAVALRVEMNPKLLVIDYQHLGQCANDINDFQVPVSSFPFPLVNGELTKAAFLECQKQALEKWKEYNRAFLKRVKGSIVDAATFFVMHTPFPKMVEWAAALLWRCEKEGRNKEGHISLSQCLKTPKLFKEYKKEIDKIRKRSPFREFFEKKVRPSLRYAPFIGNSYTCSIFISLISVLERMRKGQQIGISGYGSGAGSLFLRAIGVMEKPFKSTLSSQIKKGEKLTIEQYEEWRKSVTD